MKKGNKSSKPFWIVVLVYCCVVLLVASFLLSSGAKYRAKIKGRTEMNVAELNAALLESLTQKDAESNYEQAPLGSGSDLVLWGMYPGMPAREYAFVVSNGTDTDYHASVDIEFTVLLRSMENVPLKYTLVNGENEYPAQHSPYPTVIADEHKQTSDTDWKEYSFYEYENSPREISFRLTASDSDLSMQTFKLRVEWPITDTDLTKPTNDVSYMNEVEIINVLIKLNSAIYYDVPVTPVDDVDKTGIGVIVLMPNLVGGALTSTGTDVTYDVSYDAFTLVDGNYRYDFDITNGNRMYQTGINATTYTDYTISVRIPVSYYTQELSEIKLAYKDASGTDTVLSPVSAEYVKYDLLQSSNGYGSFVVVSETDVPHYEAATDTDLQYRIYKTFSYEIPNGDARLINRRPSETDLSYTAYDTNRLTLVLANDTVSQKLVDNPNREIDAVMRRLQIMVHGEFITEE